MTKKNYDAIVIGTGQAGTFLAQRLAGAGMKVAIIERKLFGGTCVNTGCVPTKTMIASAYAAHMVRRAAYFGVVKSICRPTGHSSKHGAPRAKGRSSSTAPIPSPSIPKGGFSSETEPITAFKSCPRRANS